MRPSVRVKYPKQEPELDSIYDMTEEESNLLKDRTWTTTGDLQATKVECMRRRLKSPKTDTTLLPLKKGLWSK